MSYRAPRAALGHPDATIAPLERIRGFSQLILLDGRAIGRWGLGSDRVETRLAIGLSEPELAGLMGALTELAGFYGVAVSEPTRS